MPWISESCLTNALEAQALHYAGRDEEAVDRLNKTFEINPDFWIARLMLARIYIGQSRWNDAIAELEKARAASGGNTETISLTAYALARSGRSDEARKAVDEFQNGADQGYVPSYKYRLAYNGLGESGQAFHCLYDAIERRDVRLILLKVDHKWDNLRSDARFLSIIKRIGLE